MTLGDEMRALAFYELALKRAARDQAARSRRRLRSGDCAFCGEFGEDLVMDHDHATGRIRGLVHPACNRIIGSHDDATAKRLAEYLKRDLDLGVYPKLTSDRS
jgi:Recombination endonuclease VII